jgi:hypothetical protein
MLHSATTRTALSTVRAAQPPALASAAAAAAALNTVLNGQRKKGLAEKA